MAVKVIRKFRNLFDVTFGTPSDGDVVTYDSGTDKLTLAPPAGGGGGAPSGPAGGVLGGTYPNPSFAADMATQAELDANAAASVNDGDAAGGVLSGTYPNPGFASDMATQAELDAHVNDALDAHDASAVSFSPTGTIAATDVQAAIAEVAAEAGTGSGSGEALVLEIAQTAHGLDVGDWVRLNGSGDYVVAQANSETNAEVVGLVVAEADANNFTLQRSGYVDTGLSGLTAGTVYFLSPTTPGEITATEPTADGQVSKPLIVAESATTGWLSSEMRGVVVPGSGGTSLSLDVTQTAHGLDVGDWVRLDGDDYVVAQADSIENSEVVGVVTAEADANNFTLATGGHVEGLSGLTAGTLYFLDETTAGAITATEPSANGEVSKPVLIADSTSSGWIFNMRGAVVADPINPLVPMPTSFGGSADTDFNGSLGPWTAVAGSAGTISLLETSTSITRYDLTSVPGWLLAQVGHATLIEFRCDYTLADGESIVIPLLFSGPSASGDNASFALRLNESSDATSTTGNYLACMIEQDTTEWAVQANSSADASGSEVSSINLYNGETMFLRIARTGTTYACFVSKNGIAWYFIYRQTGIGTPYANIWISLLGPSSGLTYMPIVAIPWTKVIPSTAIAFT